MATNGTPTHAYLECKIFNCQQCSEATVAEVGFAPGTSTTPPSGHHQASAQSTPATAATADSPPTRNSTITYQHSVPGPVLGWHVPNFIHHRDDPIISSIMEAYRDTASTPHPRRDHGR